MSIEKPVPSPKDGRQPAVPPLPPRIKNAERFVKTLTAENERLRALLADAVDSFDAMEKELRRLEREQNTDHLRVEVRIAATIAGIWKNRYEKALTESEANNG